MSFEAWRALALAPPRAYGEPPCSGILRQEPEDFRVEEDLGFAPDGAGAHLLLKVRKRNANTAWVAQQLARELGCAVREVGFAGLKDRRALAIQWFSLPASPRALAQAPGLERSEFVVLEAHRHGRKLPRGALAGNAFTLRIRALRGSAEQLRERCGQIARCGVPNYFGPQRFGRDGSNLQAIERWCEADTLPWGREGRAFVYSAGRALLFNAVLARRVTGGSWNRLLGGEIVNLAGRRSWFVAEAIDAELEARLQRHDVHPTGPLVGAGITPGGEAGRLEAEVLAPYERLITRLNAAGLEAGRRALRLVPEGLRFTLAGDELTIEFSLPAGAYATVVLRELVHTEPLEGEASDDRD